MLLDEQLRRLVDGEDTYDDDDTLTVAVTGLSIVEVRKTVIQAVGPLADGEGDSDSAVAEWGGAWDVAQAPQAVLVHVDQCDAVAPAFRRVLRELDAAGATSASTVPSIEDDMPRPGRPDLLECRMRVAGARRDGVRWTPDDPALRRVFLEAIAWCGAEGRRLGYQTRTLPLIAVGIRDLPRLIDDALARDGLTRVLGFGDATYRSVSVDQWIGRVTATEVGKPIARGAYQGPLGELVELMRGCAPDLVYAFVKRGTRRAYAENGSSLEFDWPTRPGPHSQLIGNWEDLTVPDAFGVQLLGPGHMDRLPDSPSWRTPPVGDSVLLEHVDPQAWYVAPLVTLSAAGVPESIAPPKILCDARVDFAGLFALPAGVIGR